MNDDRIAWTSVSRGVYFVGLGTFLLLNSLGILPWSFWRETIAYWPMLLVALGIRLVFERSMMPWLVLFSPLLVLGTLTWVANETPGAWNHEWESISGNRPAEVKRWVLEGRLAMVDLDLSAKGVGNTKLVDGRISPPGWRVLRVSKRDGTARVSVGRQRKSWSFIGFPARTHRLEMRVTRDLPLKLDLDLAFADGEIDLASAPVTGVDFDGAFNDLILNVGTPASDVRVDLDGAFNKFILVVPPTVPVTFHRNGFLNRVRGRPGAGSLSGPGYRLDLDGAFNRVVIRSD